MPVPPAVRPGAFAASIRASQAVAIIAELKRRSPSKGDLDIHLDAAAQARAFERGGAACMSVLTDPEFFGGSLNDLRAARATVDLPLLRKDFHIHEDQLAEAREAGASAVLLIARALHPDRLVQLVRSAIDLDLEPVVEVRTEEELERAVHAGAEIIGVNSRNLETLEVDERVPDKLVPRIPTSALAVWESGVRSVEDVKRAADAGADAVLIGSALSRAADAESLLQSLIGVRRRQRRG